MFYQYPDISKQILNSLVVRVQNSSLISLPLNIDRYSSTCLPCTPVSTSSMPAGGVFRDTDELHVRVISILSIPCGGISVSMPEQVKDHTNSVNI